MPKPEGICWLESEKPASEVPQRECRRKPLIHIPNTISEETVEDAKRMFSRKKWKESVRKARFEKMNESTCIQIMHAGSYSTESETSILVIRGNVYTPPILRGLPIRIMVLSISMDVLAISITIILPRIKGKNKLPKLV